MSEGIFDAQDWSGEAGATGIQCLEARKVAEHPTITYTTELLSPKCQECRGFEALEYKCPYFFTRRHSNFLIGYDFNFIK